MRDKELEEVRNAEEDNSEEEERDALETSGF